MFHWFEKKDKAEKYKEITSFETVRLKLSGMRFYTLYEVVNRGETSEVSEYNLARREDENERIPERQAVVKTEDVLAVLNQCSLGMWNGFHGAHPKGVLDGIQFHLEATVNDAKQVKAEGSQNFPKRFDVLRDWFYQTMRAAEAAEKH